jgi:hypothetical protein
VLGRVLTLGGVLRPVVTAADGGSLVFDVVASGAGP